MSSHLLNSSSQTGHILSQSPTKNDSASPFLTNLYNLPVIQSPNRSGKRHSIYIKTSDIPQRQLEFESKHSLTASNSGSLRIQTKHVNITSRELQAKHKAKIHRVFKEKFYEDTENTFNQKQKKKNVFRDPGWKDKVWQMKKVGAFWKCVCDYANPWFSIQKFKNSIAERKERDYNNNYEVIKPRKYKGKVYTMFSLVEKNHLDKKWKEKAFYERLAKEKNVKWFK